MMRAVQLNRELREMVQALAADPPFSLRLVRTPELASHGEWQVHELAPWWHDRQREMSLLASDLFHNLRAALDNWAWAVSEDERASFPVLKSAPHATGTWEASVRKCMKGASARHAEMVLELKAWPGSPNPYGEAASLVHALDIESKHRLVPVVVQSLVDTWPDPQTPELHFTYEGGDFYPVLQPGLVIYGGAPYEHVEQLGKPSITTRIGLDSPTLTRMRGRGVRLTDLTRDLTLSFARIVDGLLT